MSSFSVAVPIAMLVAIGLIGHAMFVNGPVDESRSTGPTGDQSQDTPQFSAD